MKRTSIALAIMSASMTSASIRSWNFAEISPLLFASNSYPVSGGKTGITAARRAAKKRRRARNG